MLDAINGVTTSKPEPVSKDLKFVWWLRGPQGNSPYNRKMRELWWKLLIDPADYELQAFRHLALMRQQGFQVTPHQRMGLRAVCLFLLTFAETLFQKLLVRDFDIEVFSVDAVLKLDATETKDQRCFHCGAACTLARRGHLCFMRCDDLHGADRPAVTIINPAGLVEVIAWALSLVKSTCATICC
jgi:hypothetical protein